MFERTASLMANSPIAVDPPYMINGIFVLAGSHGCGNAKLW